VKPAYEPRAPLPFEWLLDPVDVPARLRTLVDVFDRPADDPEVVEARANLLRSAEVTAMFERRRPDGSFGDLLGADSADGTLDSLSRLLLLGVPPRDPRIVGSVRAWLAARQVPLDGPGDDPEGAGGAIAFRSEKGRAVESDVASCITGDGVALALKVLGPVEEVRRAVFFLLRRQRHDGGWLSCNRWSLAVRAKTTLLRGRRTHDEEGDPSVRSCRFGTFRVLRGLATLPPELRDEATSRAITRAAGFFLSRHVTGRSDDPDTEAIPKVPRFSASFSALGNSLHQNSDPVSVLRVLVDLGHGTDPRLSRALARVLERQRIDGRWVNESSGPGMLSQPVGAPSRWVTLDVIALLQRIARSHGTELPLHSQ